MPKSSKKQKEKSSDFKKAKLKLGKGKKPANNAVDTSFKAHSIALPTQSIMVEKSGPITKKHQSLSDLVSLLKHYSSNSRKDALVGLRELFSTHADILTSSVPVVLPACCKLLSDEDGSVRKANIQFMDWYLRHISQNTIAPHSSALMLYVTSALTHIFPEIRIDAIKILDILLDVCPGIVVSPGPNGHAHRVLQGYLGLLVGDVMRSDDEIINTSAVTLSAQSKLSVITSLARFLQKVSDDTSSDSELWYLRGSFNSAKAYQSFVELLSDTQKNSTLEPISDTEIAFSVDDTWSKTENWSIEDVKHAFDFCLLDSPDISASESGGLLEKAEKYLHRLLVELWLDHGPPAMMALDSRTDPSTELRIVVSTLRLARSLYFDVREPALSRRNDSHLLVILSHFSVYFPIVDGEDTYSSEVWEELQAINLIYSELLAICLLSRQGPVSSRSIPNDKAMSTGPLDMEKEISRISPWILGMIRGRPTPSYPLGRPPSEQTMFAILPTLWAVISQSPSIEGRSISSTQLDILQAAVEQVQQPQTSLATKLLLTRFLTSLLLLQTDASYNGSFKLIENANPASQTIGKSTAQLFEDWILNIPKLLWEIGERSPKISRCVILYLLRCAQRRVLDITATTVDQILQRLVTFFCVQHPTRGALLGPFAKFTGPDGVNVQKLALDLVVALGRYCNDSRRRGRTGVAEISNPQVSNLFTSVTNSVANTAHMAYWEGLQAKL